MKHQVRRLILLPIIFLIFSSIRSNAQTDSILQICEKYIQAPYISDGQQYVAPLEEDKVKTFTLTFFGGTTYRIACCSDLQKGNLLFTLIDAERNVLFTNKNHNNSPYWDFHFKTTMQCVLELRIDSENPTSCQSVVLIGFKDEN